MVVQEGVPEPAPAHERFLRHGNTRGNRSSPCGSKTRGLGSRESRGAVRVPGDRRRSGRGGRGSRRGSSPCRWIPYAAAARLRVWGLVRDPGEELSEMERVEEGEKKRSGCGGSEIWNGNSKRRARRKEGRRQLRLVLVGLDLPFATGCGGDQKDKGRTSPAMLKATKSYWAAARPEACYGPCGFSLGAGSARPQSLYIAYCELYIRLARSRSLVGPTQLRGSSFKQCFVFLREVLILRFVPSLLLLH